MKVERDCKTFRRKCMHDAESSFGGEVVLSAYMSTILLSNWTWNNKTPKTTMILFFSLLMTLNKKNFYQRLLAAALRNEGVKRINWLLSSRTCFAFGINPSLLCFWLVYLLMTLTTTSIF